MSVRGQLDTVGGEKLAAALESLVQADRPAGDRRSRAQQLGDALVQLADNALASGGLPMLRTVKPQLLVTIPLADLLDPAPDPAPPTPDSVPPCPPPEPAGRPATAPSPG